MGKLILRKQGGFSVVELMVVLVLLGLVLAFGYMYFGFGLTTFARGERQSIAQQGIRLAADFISSEIRFADEIILNPVDASESEYYYIQQQGDSVVYFYRDENGSELDKRYLLDSDFDDIAYSISFREESFIGGIEANLVISFNLEADNNLYSLDTNVFIMNLNNSSMYEDLSVTESPTTVIKFGKPIE